MGRVEGKVALVTGAGRGQGRAHALRLAQEGADIIAVDLALPQGDEQPFDWTGYGMGTAADLEETVRAVEDVDRRILARRADVRDRAALQAVVDEALDEWGHIDVVCANAGICPFGPRSWEITPEQWNDVLAVNLTGVWNTTSAVIPAMIESGRGGSIVVTSSGAGIRAVPHLADYTATKAGVIGFVRSLAQEVGRYSIRVNLVAPATVNTDMVRHESMYRLFRPDLPDPGFDDVLATLRRNAVLPQPFLEPVDIANAVLWLASDEARYVTGVVLPVDLGVSIK